MIKLLSQTDLKNKTVLLRVDLNVPIFEDKILSDFRIKQSIPTIQHLLKNNNRIIILSHLGRPVEGVLDEEYSLKRVCDILSSLINEKITFIKDWTDNLIFKESNIIMCENVRFQLGEKSNDPKLSKMMASLADCYVFDAFGVAHRSECSTYGVTEFLESYAGLLVEKEIDTLKKLLSESKPPFVTIISGAKISTKLKIIEKLIVKSDYFFLGGGILNTFLLAMNYNIGESLFEKDFINEAKKIISSDNFNKIILPIDVMCIENNNFDMPKNKDISMVQSNDKILDIGMKTIEKYTNIINDAGTVFWNGPMGYVEKTPFDIGTIKLSEAIASSDNFSIIGGGDTIPIIEKLGIQDKITCLSTGGGSLLKYIEGQELPIFKKLGMYN
tara:strand:- start:42 stop:1199 length:1158 start_codon:yes stop_codon:yes gene_type:complete